ncbi:MAG: glycosyltransferase family 1 protein [Candidatus Sumerlaeia bacterium]|nr:glycosyltransferase family 1 protein [Candidatus Sumerlaeia bacterium]
MKIGLTTFGADGGKSGISRYLMCLMKEFVSYQNEHDFLVHLYYSEQEIFLPKGHRFQVVLHNKSIQPPVRNIWWHQWSLGRWCKKEGIDVMFLPAANRRASLSLPCPSVGTVHDFSSLHVKGKYDASRHFYITKVLPLFCRRLTHILTVSESSKRDIVQVSHVPENRVTVTPLAADPLTMNPQTVPGENDRLKERYGIQEPFVLYTSRLEHPGKNHVRLVEAFESLANDHSIPHQLVFAGSDWSGSEAIHQRIQQSAVKNRIRCTGFVESADLPALYRCCSAFVFPSLYEGFGLPILEAMGCGAPVACSNVSSMPEVAGDAAVLFAPEDSTSIRSALEVLLLDEAKAQDYRQRGIARAAEFSWQRTAASTLSVLAQTAKIGRTSA